MKNLKLHNRIISGALAAIFAVTGSFVPQTIALAADGDYFVKFYDSVSKITSANTQIVEGTSIGVNTKIPTDYTISETTPFAVTHNSVAAPGMFEIFSNFAGKSYTLKALAGSAGTSVKEYTLETIYTAFVSNGSGSASGSYLDAVTGEQVINSYKLTAISKSGIAMTNDSSITFTANGAESTAGIVTFGAVTNATGAFSIYNGAIPTNGKLVGTGANRTFDLEIASQDPTNPKALLLSVSIEGDGAIVSGTSFTINFRRETLNSLIATVITKQKLVDDTAKSVQDNPENEQATQSGEKYVQLPSPDKLDSINQNFQVLSKFHRANVDVTLEWEWAPLNPAHQNFVVLEKNPGKNTSAFVIKQRPAEDMSGKLLVTAVYDGVRSANKGEVPVLIYGAGANARLEPVTQIVGVPAAPPTERTEQITAFPQIMDVYDAKADFNIYPTAPNGAYKLNALLTFGASGGRAEKAVITKDGAGEFALYIDGDAKEYVFGSDIINIGQSKTVQLHATKAGQASFTVKYYNTANQELKLMEQKHTMRISDNRPKTDARLSDLRVRLVAATTQDQNVLNNTYKFGVMPYGYDKDSTTYDIRVPFKAESIEIGPVIPPDTSANKTVQVISGTTTENVISGSYGTKIMLTPLLPTQVRVSVTAQSGAINEYTINIIREDPSGNSLLKTLEVLRTDGTADNLLPTFAPNVLEYNISVPYAVSELQVKPFAQDPWAQDITFNPLPKAIRFLWWEWPTNKFDLTCDYDAVTGIVSNNLNKIEIMVSSEGGLTQTKYTLNITREPPSNDGTLSSLSVTDALGKPYNFKGNQKFDPKLRNYTVEIPYATQEVELSALHNSATATKMRIKAPAVYGAAERSLNLKAGALSTFRNVVTTQDKLRPTADRNVFVYEIYVTAEDGTQTQPPYTITFERTIAANDNSLTSLKIFDEKGGELKFNDGQNFTPEIRDYYVTIPYNAKTINIEAAHRGPTAQKMTLNEPVVYGGNTTETVLKLNDLRATRYASLDVSQNATAPNKDKNAFFYQLFVTAEDASTTKPPYTIHVVRSEPSADTRLATLDIVDQDKKALDSFAFNQEQLEYTINVPYAITNVTITPKAVAKGAAIVADGVEILPTRQSVTIELLSGKERIFKIEVRSESNETRVYTLKFMRQGAETEARLSELTLGTLALKPKFDPNRYEYTIVVPEGVKEYAATPTAFSPLATITVNGKPVKSGAVSGNLRTVNAQSVISIEVTAQDGKTKVTYKISVTDENYIERSNNANLRSMSISKASIKPYFSPAINSYGVALSPETDAVTIKPKAEDPNAKIKVTEGTRELESFNGVYETGIRTAETTIKVEVTSPDKKVVKSYEFAINTEDEELQGKYKPVTADMINWEQDPIIVDISKYPVISAEVFNTLKTEHPTKTMIFQGNDYSLTVKGSDLLTLVPSTDLFDFSMTYNGPDNETILALIRALDGRNATLVPTIVNFGYHGPLPAPMTLQLSLGGFYKNSRLLWNYYNRERNRIDYYGYFGTNTQGTFSVPITHMSNYVITTSMVYGSENKVGFAGGGENIGGAIAGKPNPSTGGLFD